MYEVLKVSDIFKSPCVVSCILPSLAASVSLCARAVVVVSFVSHPLLSSVSISFLELPIRLNYLEKSTFIIFFRKLGVHYTSLGFSAPFSRRRSFCMISIRFSSFIFSLSLCLSILLYHRYTHTKKLRFCVMCWVNSLKLPSCRLRFAPCSSRKVFPMTGTVSVSPSARRDTMPGVRGRPYP